MQGKIKFEQLYSSCRGDNRIEKLDPLQIEGSVGWMFFLLDFFSEWINSG